MCGGGGCLHLISFLCRWSFRNFRGLSEKYTTDRRSNVLFWKWAISVSCVESFFLSCSHVPTPCGWSENSASSPNKCTCPLDAPAATALYLYLMKMEPSSWRCLKTSSFRQAFATWYQRCSSELINGGAHDSPRSASQEASPTNKTLSCVQSSLLT